jgi:DNA invertase Pin-like site-specific DNA recombinase
MTKQPERRPQAGIYLRISQDATGEQAGVTRQQEDCLELVEQQGWTVFEIYTDNDTSAYKSRPGYQRMLADVKAGHIDAVVAWHPDRLYRRLTDLEGLIAAIEERNVILRTVRAGELDLSTPTGRMLARILSATAQAEGEVKSDRWRRSWRQGREAGRQVRTGSRLFGYSRDGEVIDHEAAIARVMASKIREGSSILGLARWLDDQGVRATRGSKWTPQSIKRYLTNPRLAGWSTLNGEIVADGQWEPILDRDVFEIVRALLTARTRTHVPRKSLLLGLIFCGRCGHRLITSGQKGKRTYRCPKRPGMEGCGRVSGNAGPIEEMVESYARARLADNRVRQRVAELHQHPTETIAELAALDVRIRELEQQLDQPDVPVAALLSAISRAKQRRAGLNDQLAAHGASPLPVAGTPWPSDLQRRRALIDLVVSRVALLPSDPAWASARGFDSRRVEIEPH